MSDEELERIFSAIDPADALSDESLDGIFPAGVLSERIDEGIKHHRPVRVVRPWRHLRRGITVPLALLLIAGGTAAAVTLLRSPEPVRLSALMGCYSQPTLTPKVIVVTGLTTTPGPTCEHLLAESIRRGSVIPTSTLRDFSPPVLCVGKSGDLKVFPKSTTTNLCDTLGLAPFSGKIVVDAVARFTLAAEHLVRTHTCLALDEAVVDVKALLRTNGLGSTWKVVVNRNSPPNSCVAFGFDDVKKIVYVAGL